MRYYEFKIYLDETEESLAFDAFVADKKYYRIKYDLNDSYTKMFKKIISGTYKKKFCNKDNYHSDEDIKFETYLIDGDDAIENINTFQQNHHNLYDFRIHFERSTLVRSLGFNFDGSDYGLSKGTSVDALTKSTEFSNMMYKTIANNVDFGEAFSAQPVAGSIKLDIYTTNSPNLTVVEKVFDDLIHFRIDRVYMTSQNSDGNLYRKIIKKLNSLKQFDNLNKFTFYLFESEYLFTKKHLKYLFSEGNNLYGETVSLSAMISHVIPTLKDQQVSSLVVNTEDNQQVHCHFEFNLEKIEELNRNLGRSIELDGERISTKTININSYSII